MLAQKRIVRDFKKLRVCRRAEEFISEIDKNKTIKDQSPRIISELPIRKGMNNHRGRKEEAITVHKNVLC